MIGDLAEAEKAVKEVLSLPMGLFLKEEEISSICKTTREIMTNDKAQMANNNADTG
ncbi:hypothetical protein M1N62_02420 [Thermodesulfovibrionales bacterium]|nr:hypothetical protein [Thermodesulfovibrionales bacterium]MCL0067052.1 hypothetical protein [Thermodesulfovibrionales bacterium]